MPLLFGLDWAVVAIAKVEIIFVLSCSFGILAMR